MGKTGKKILGAVVAVAAIFFTGGTAALAYIGKALVTAAVSIGISRLVAKRATTSADAGGDGGGRVQLPPATQNKLPVVYGSAFIGGAMTDAMLSTDQQTMWYVVALAEVSDDQGGGGGSYTYDTTNIYYDGKRVIFGTDGAVDALETNNTTGQTDTRMAGKLFIYTFVNGSSSNVNNNHPYTAAQILSTTNGVPAAQAWGANQTMTNCAFAIVKVIYSADAGTTGIGALTVKISNSIDKPGDAILDYMLNTRYGCALPIASIDTTSLIALNSYSDELIDYKPVGWNPGDPYSQQARYRINGPLDTGQSCLNNLQFLVDSADSWLQYSELTGKWRVVINKAYDQTPDAQTLNDLFLVDSSNLVGGIDVSPIDLNETYNQIEVAYPNANIKDQTDYQIIDLFDTDPSLLSANEAVNRLNITLPLVNNAVQAKYLAARRIYQSREDLVIGFKMDFSGIQIEAGDIIRVNHEVYGWGPTQANPSNPSKLFRVSAVAEEKDADGNLFAAIQAFEYSNNIFADIVQDYVPSFNTGLEDPNVIGFPGTPTVAYNPTALDGTNSFKVTSTVPTTGIVLYMDFNYGNTSNVLTHRLYRSVEQSNGSPFTASASANIDINDLPSGNYYFSVTARNNLSGKRSNSSALFNWTGSIIPNVSTNTACNANSVGNVITSDQILNIDIGANVYLANGTGNLGNTTIVTSITSTGNPTIFTVDPTPAVALSNACITVIAGGFTPNVYRPNTISGNSLIDYSVTSNKLSNTGVVAGTYSRPNLTVGQDGRITSIANSSGSFLGGVNYSIFTNPVTMPINAAANSTRNVPIYIIGTGVDANNLYPWYQGTSVISAGSNGNNYYGANSTGTFQPQNAGVPLLQDGDDNWYTMVVDNSPNGNFISANFTYGQEFGTVIVSDTIGTIVQIMPALKFGNLPYYQGYGDLIQTVTLDANAPFQYDVFYFYQVDVMNLKSSTMLIRNVTENANVTIIKATQSSTQIPSSTLP